MVTDTYLLQWFLSLYRATEGKSLGEKHQTRWRVLVSSRADYDFDGSWGA